MKPHLLLALLSGLSLAPGLALPALAQSAPQPAVPSPSTLGQPAPRPARDPALQEAIAKSNAYIELMNRTLRAKESWGRYTSWVNLKTGPTGKERYITYGLYSLYDVRSEIEKANAATLAEPKTPELDATVLRYIKAYETLAPLITKAAAYYERQDYKADGAAEGKALHAQLVPAAETFLAERVALDLLMKQFSRDLNRRELATLDPKSPQYQVKIVMIGAEEMIELMPSQDKPIVDMKVYDEALARYAASVRAFDEWNQANPGKLSSFDSAPGRFLGKLREFQTKLARAKGDARRGAGQDLVWIVNDYNMMISSSQMALRFSR